MTDETRRETIGLLKAEIKFIEQGEYRRSKGDAWRVPSIFLDSPICLHLNKAHHSESCKSCLLLAFVPEEHRQKRIPCHYIPLTPVGDTVKSVEGWADQEELEEKVLRWLKAALCQLESETKQPAEE